jgi:hypothetical protein
MIFIGFIYNFIGFILSYSAFKISNGVKNCDGRSLCVIGNSPKPECVHQSCLSGNLITFVNATLGKTPGKTICVRALDGGVWHVSYSANVYYVSIFQTGDYSTNRCNEFSVS